MTELVEGASFLGYVLVVFVVVFYLPHVFFKFWAELYIDLGWRRDASKLEDFVGAALPSVIFNLGAAACFNVLSWLPWVSKYTVDWAVVASLMTGEKGALSDFIYTGELARTVGLYLALLYLIAALNGLLFGYVIYLRLRSADEPSEKFLDLISAPADISLVFGLIGWFWMLFYQETLVPFFAWTVRETWVMIRTTDGPIFHGRFARYETNVDGAIDIIRLEEVRRYNRNELQQCYERGRIGITDFDGTLHLKWEHIADINRVDPNRIFNLMYEQWCELNDLRRKQNLPEVPPPLGLDVTGHEEDADEESIHPS